MQRIAWRKVATLAKLGGRVIPQVCQLSASLDRKASAGAEAPLPRQTYTGAVEALVTLAAAHAVAGTVIGLPMPSFALDFLCTLLS